MISYGPQDTNRGLRQWRMSVLYSTENSLVLYSMILHDVELFHGES